MIGTARFRVLLSFLKIGCREVQFRVFVLTGQDSLITVSLSTQEFIWDPKTVKPTRHIASMYGIKTFWPTEHEHKDKYGGKHWEGKMENIFCRISKESEPKCKCEPRVFKFTDIAIHK